MVGNMVSNVYAESNDDRLFINKALGVFQKVITRTTTTTRTTAFRAISDCGSKMDLSWSAGL